MSAEPGGDPAAAVTPLELPSGRAVELPGRGTTFVRELAGPPGAPTLLLLHGWTATADLNWGRSYAALARSHRVVSLDHRGHGRGIRSRRPFRLADCADDAAALLDVLDIPRAVAVGYSMGGAVAQLLARRHPERVQGLVLAATAARFSGTRAEQRTFLGLAGVAVASRATPEVARRRLAAWVIERRGRGYEPWVLAEIMRSDWTAILEAGRELGRFDSRLWLGDLEAPSAVVVTEPDEVVPPSRQRELVAALRDPSVHEIVGGHDVCVTAPERWLPAMAAACASVTTRATADPA